jgi:hypothetical protein
LTVTLAVDVAVSPVASVTVAVPLCAPGVAKACDAAAVPAVAPSSHAQP